MHLINRKNECGMLDTSCICIAILSKYICIINVAIIILNVAYRAFGTEWHLTCFFLNGCVFFCWIGVWDQSISLCFGVWNAHMKIPPPFIFLCSLSLCWGPECLWGGERWSVELACCLSHKYHYTNKHSKHNCPNMVKLTTAQILESVPCICFAVVGKYFWL